MGMYCFGIDVGGTSVKCGLFLTNGTLVEQWEIPTRLENNGSSILPDVADAIKVKLDERGITKDNVDGVGIGIPGPVNENGEVPMAVNLHWGFKAVASELSALTGLPAKAANDANIAALGEAWKGAAEGSKNVIMVTLGTGVGGGIIIDGKLYTGCNSLAGELGHIVIRQGGEPCGCGRRGCLEAYSSAAALVKFAHRALDAGRESSLRENGSGLNAKHICDAVDAGDALACELFETYCDDLACGLSSFINIFQPECIVLGGGLAGYGEKLLAPLRKRIEKETFRGDTNTELVLASLGNDAGLVGAAML